MRASRQFHASWMISLACGAMLLGVVVSRAASTFLGNSVWWLALGLTFAVAAFFSRVRYIAVSLMVLAGLLVGYWRGAGYNQSLVAYEKYIGQRVSVSGRVYTDPSHDAQGQLRIKVTDVYIKDERVGGILWVTLSDQTPLKRSNYVTLDGLLSKGFGTVPAALYRAKISAYSETTYSDPGRPMRDRFASAVRLGIKDPEAALANGFLVGEQASLPEKLSTDLQLLGLTHIVVASGYNLTILVRFSRRLFARVSRFASLAASLTLVYMFTNIAGNSPSMSRASIVVVMSLVAWFYGRKVHQVVLIVISAAISVMLQPAYARGDIGWLLSFGSFVGVLLLAPLLHSYFWHQKKPGFIRQLCVETAAAYLTTLPLIIFIFGRFSPISIIANMLVLPLISPVMALTFVCGVVGLVVPGVAKIIGYPPQALLDYVTWVVGKLSTWPSASTEAKLSASSLVGWYALLLVLMLFLWRRSGHSFREFNVIE